MLRRLALWSAFGLSLMQAVFFAGAAVLPLQTVGPPAFDRPLIREQMWAASGQPMLYLMTVAVLLLVALPRPRILRRGPVALALVLMLGAHVVLLIETPLLIKGGELAMAQGAANAVLMATRVASTALAALSTFLVARIVVVQLLRAA